MSIIPLPVFEEELDPVKRGLTEEEIIQYEGAPPPETVVVRYGRMRLIGEFPCQLDRRPGCGTKLIVRSPRGTEIADLLTTSCDNGGCGSSITRKQMLEYIENSGGKRFPFTTKGRVLRIASPDELREMESIQQATAPKIKRVREVAQELGLAMDIVELEPVLSQDHLSIFYTSNDRIDFREMVRQLAKEFSCRIEMRQVGARDVARLKADYERCGQHGCCRQFLKVLKPVSMRSAKVQKATLDPLKISGRCGRLMCCLRYEDATYTELKKRLPHKRSKVQTSDGPGIVISTQILTQLVLVELDEDRQRIAVPVEDLTTPPLSPKQTSKQTPKAKQERNDQQPRQQNGSPASREATRKEPHTRPTEIQKKNQNNDTASHHDAEKTVEVHEHKSKDPSDQPSVIKQETPSSHPTPTEKTENSDQPNGQAATTSTSEASVNNEQTEGQPKRKRHRRRGKRGGKNRNKNHPQQ